MSFLIGNEKHPILYRLPLHFDVPSRAIQLSTFISTATEYENLLVGFNRDLLNSRIQFKVYVLPPEPGSFKSVLAVTFIAGGAFWAFTESDVGQGFIKGLTGKLPAEISEEIGEQLREKIEEFQEIDPTFETSIDDKQNFIGCGILVEASKTFLQLSTKELANREIDIDLTPYGFAAKNDFYLACELNPEVSGIGFTDDTEFPINRDLFPTRMAPVS